MTIGTSADILDRVKKLIPRRWFSYVAPNRDAIIGGIADSAAWNYALILYAKAQLRISTAYGIWLDIISYDYLNRFIIRNKMGDDVFRAFIKATILQERVTRAGMTKAITTLTTITPWVFEPWNTFDTGAYSGPSTIIGPGVTLWNASDANIGITVTSNFQLDLNFAGGFFCARATTFHSDHRYYEFKINYNAASDYASVGFGNINASLSIQVGNDANAVGFFTGNGFFYINGVQTDAGVGGAPVSGSVIGLDFDPANNRIRARINNGTFGTWVSTSGLAAGPYYPIAGLFNSSGRLNIIAAWTLAQFTYALPAGALPWDVVNVVVSPRRLVYGSMGYGVGQGGYGNMNLPGQAFMAITRGSPSGLPSIEGYGNTIAGYGVGSIEYTSSWLALIGITNAIIYNIINITKPTGTLMWVAIGAPIRGVPRRPLIFNAKNDTQNIVII